MREHKLFGLIALLLAVCGLLYVSFSRPAFFTDVSFLGAMIFLQLLVAVISCYRKAFFPALIMIFLFAGTAVPLQEAWTSARWLVLAVGTTTGLFLLLRGQQRPFGTFHMAAIACMLSATVSALVSSYPEIALLKALSLCLLFIYGITGARLAIHGREDQFLSILLWGAEALVYISAIVYLPLRVQLFGNRNSLGVAMGVIVLPFLLWGFFVSASPVLQRRRLFAILLCLILLLSSYERAGIVAALISSSMLCVGLRKYRFLACGIAVASVMAVGVAALVPPPPTIETDDGSLTTRFVYKGERQSGILASRLSVWDKTISSMDQHPWFGTGFGTSATDFDKGQISQRFRSAGQVTREHGNSYLEIAEWLGFLGVIPFGVLLLFLLLNVTSVFVWMRQTRNPFSPAVPLAIFIIGALVNAGFEDWLFAVGYHTCVLFWSLAFLLPDYAPSLRFPQILRHRPLISRSSSEAFPVTAPV